jgi:hypothetical protein
MKPIDTPPPQRGSPRLGDGRNTPSEGKTSSMGEPMRRAIVAVAAIAASLIAGAAHANGTITASMTVSSPPNLGNIAVGTTQTTYVITPSGSMSLGTGNFLRIKGNSASFTPVAVSLHCATFSGSGKGTCPNLTTITLTITAATGSSWPSTVENFTIASLSGATVNGTTSASSTGTTASFTLNCTGSGGKCSEGQTITFDLGMTAQLNAPPGTTGTTNMPFTVQATWN